MKRTRRANRQLHTRNPCACHCSQHTQRRCLEHQSPNTECDRFFTLSSDILSIVGFDGYFKRLSPACEQILGFSQVELLATPFLELVHPEDREATLTFIQQLTIGRRVNHFENRYRCQDGSYKRLSWNGMGVVEEELIYCIARDITPHQPNDGSDISEQLQPATALQYQREQEQLMVAIAQQIRQSLDLEEILGKTVTAVRKFLKSDRVIIYHLDAAIGGCVIAESVEGGWNTIAGTIINDCYFTDFYAQLYQQGRVQAVSDIYTAGLTPCHVKLLGQFQVRANLAVPIIQEDKLWGLLVVQQCSSPRSWKTLEIALLKQLAMQVAIAIHQSELYQQAQVEIAQRQQAEIALRQQAEREQLLAATAQRIRQSLDLNHVLDTTVTEVRHLLQADRVLLYWVNPDGLGRVITESVASGYSEILNQPLPPEIFPHDFQRLYQQGRIRKITDVETDTMAPCLAETLRQFEVRSKLVVPILQGTNLWGLLIAHQCSGPREWQAQEVDLLQQLATQVAIAIHQSELYQQAQAEIAQRQLAEAALQQQSEHERLIADIANRVRASLDLDDVLSVSVEEVRQILEADRVLILQLYADGSGSVVKEAVLPDYPIIKEMCWLDQCYPEAFYEFYLQGNTRIVADVATDNWGDYLGEFMQLIGVKSQIIAPIVQVNKGSNESNIWGFLIVHACAYHRPWQLIEADLLQRLASKLAIAIQQAELYQQVKQLNANLETQVQERTLELQQALHFESLLKQITDQVRDSLDEAKILQTAVQALTTGLNVQCCDTALYDFEQSSSTIHYEHIVSGVPTAKGQTFLFSNLPEVYKQLLNGRNVQFCTIATTSFWRGGATQPFTILSCPLMDDQGVLGDLWLFKPSRSIFNASEIRLVEQVANQCAIALRQSRLYQAAQAQVSELERLNQLKDNFLSTVSHELRTPMSNIKMAIQMLDVMRSQENLTTLGSERTDRYFNILQNECEREISLINDLLDLTRLDAGTEPLNLVTIDLQNWIPHILEPFEQRIHHQQQLLTIEIPKTIPPVRTDLSYLERVLTELLNNACKYTPLGEHIAVSVNMMEGEMSSPNIATPLSITVCNTGVEIPGSELEHIFEKFYRIPNNDPWKCGGTGLGLALVQRLVDQINGKIEVQSSHQQTTFTIHIPLVLSAA